MDDGTLGNESVRISDLAGRVALITGGGRRLGKGISMALAEAGCRVIIHYRQSQDEAAATAEALNALGAEASCLAADLSDADQIERMFDEIEQSHGRLDILVNSAASFRRQAWDEINAGDWDDAMEVNLRAAFLCLRSATPLMRAAAAEAGFAAVAINVADLSGVFAWPGYAPHGVSKAGLLHLTRVAARELAPQIRVNSVVPGPILPPPGGSTTDESWRHLIGRLPLARSGLPAEVGAAVVFLVANDFITGESIRVDGGEHLLGAGHRQL